MSSWQKAYDITTTSAYRLFRRDEPALLMNSAKRWPTEKELITFGRKHCMLDDRVCREILKTVIRAVTKVGKTIPDEIKAHPGSEHVLSAMVVQWNDAIKSLYFKKDGQKKTCKTELDDVERALIDRYGDPYKNQKDRKDRLGKISVQQRTVMHPPTL